MAVLGTVENQLLQLYENKLKTVTSEFIFPIVVSLQVVFRNLSLRVCVFIYEVICI